MGGGNAAWNNHVSTLLHEERLKQLCEVLVSLTSTHKVTCVNV